MKITSIFIFLLIISSQGMKAQTRLKVQGSSPKLYLIHAVAAKENWYSIGRLYNLSPKDIAPFNSLDMDKPLAIGQQVKIPLNPTNFSQDNQKGSDEVLVPVYHTVLEKEWMYRISQNYNKVPIERIQDWNKVSSDGIKAGMNLVVGFLKVKPGQSAFASLSKEEDFASNKPVQKTNSNPITKTEEPKKETVKIAEKKADEKLPKTENKPLENKPVDTKQPVSSRLDYQGGFFRAQYDEGGRTASGAAGIFRSTSGWQDGKYYALMNNVPVGTIIKVANPTSGRSVYAKVLGNLPDMKESSGLTVRISDAAATELGLASNKFTVDVKY